MTKARTTKKEKVSSDGDRAVQDKVDMYIAMHEECKKLEKQLRILRKDIEPYMVENNLTTIKGRQGGSVNIESRNMANLSANYTSYDPEILTVLPELAAKECRVEVVDKKKLEAMATLDLISDINIDHYKVPKVVDCFVVK